MTTPSTGILNREYLALQQEPDDAERERALAVNARVEHQKIRHPDVI